MRLKLTRARSCFLRKYNLLSVLTQLEIIKIHRYLEMKWHQRKKGGG